MSNLKNYMQIASKNAIEQGAGKDVRSEKGAQMMYNLSVSEKRPGGQHVTDVKVPSVRREIDQPQVKMNRW
jgi:hypothetical protein